MDQTNRAASTRRITEIGDLYPFESHWLDLGGVCMHYVDQGPRGEGARPEAVVMLHGNPTWSFYYRTLIPGLSRSHRVVVPDHIGCGLSDKPQQYTYTLEQHIQNLEALIAHLGLERMTLVLHDWGGSIGMGYATRHPETIARLVVLNTSAFYVGPPDAPILPWRIKICRLPIFGPLALRGLNAFARLALPWAVHHRERLTPAVRAGYLLPYDSWRNRVAILRFVQDIPLERQHPTRKTIQQIDARLRLFADHPVLVLWGARDFCFTARDYLPGWQQRFPGAETHVIEDAGHYVVEDAHERILSWILEFLERPLPS
jgi:pimeloyl-ACP methyl ester carboxylesterase